MEDKVLNRLLDAINKNGLNEKDPLIACGINTNLFVDWKKKVKEGKTMYPSYDKIAKLSAYLNLSLDYVILGEDSSKQDISYFLEHIFSPEGKNMLSDFFQLKEMHSSNKIVSFAYTKEEKTKAKKKKIPIVGETAAGIPIYMDEPYYSENELIEVPESSKAKYALRVRGDSMEPEIKNNQIIFIKEQPTAENGQIVVVAVDIDTITCKKFYKFPDRIELRSINPFYSPRIIDKANSENFRIIGIVIDNEPTA